MRRILIVGGGYAGFYAAWKLEKKLRGHEAAVTLVDPRPYLTYQPFLPEVAAGATASVRATRPSWVRISARSDAICASNDSSASASTRRV